MVFSVGNCTRIALYNWRLVLMLQFLFLCLSCNILQRKKTEDGAEGEVAAYKNKQSSIVPKSRPVTPEDVTILFPVDVAKLTNVHSTKQVVDIVKTQLVPLLSLMDDVSYRNLLQTIVAGGAENNPLSGDLGSEIAKISSSNWFVVGARFEICDFRYPVPVQWVLNLPEDLQWSVCAPAIRLVLQPFGLRSERAAQGAVKNAWAVDDKALHFVYSYHGDLSQAHRLLHGRQMAEFTEALLAMQSANALTWERFSSLANKHFSNKDAIFAGKQKAKNLLALVQKLRGAGLSGALKIPYSAQGVLPNYKNFIHQQLVQVAELEMVTHMFAATGVKPSSDNSWAFGVNLPSTRSAKLTGASFRKSPVNFSCVSDNKPNVLPKIDAVLSLGNVETFSHFPGEVFSLDAQLLESSSANQSAAHCVLSHSMARNYAKIEGGNMVGENENTAEVPPSVQLRETLQAIAAEVENPTKHSIGTQNCMSCHIVDGLREIHNLQRNALVPKTGNRLFDANLITEQSKPSEVWNLRLLGYFGRSPSLGARTVMETQLQVERFNRFNAK